MQFNAKFVDRKMRERERGDVLRAKETSKEQGWIAEDGDEEKMKNISSGIM